MADKPAGRFRFRLWQPLALLFVLGVFVAWQWSIVRERRRLRDELSQAGFRITLISQLDTWRPDYSVLRSAVKKTTAIPLTRRLLGDEAVLHIGYLTGLGITPARHAQIERMFPEAVVIDEGSGRILAP